MHLSSRRFGKSGTPLIVLHGLLGSSQNWNSAGSLLGETFQVIIPDLRNHGDSPHGPHSIADMSGDILELLNSEDIGRTILLGHSMGGLVAMHFAFHNPEKLHGLIIEDIVPETRLNRIQPILAAMNRINLTTITRRQDADIQLAAEIPDRMIRQFLLQNLKRHENNTFEWRCNVPELLGFVQNERYKIESTQRYDGATLFIGGGKSEHRIAEKEALIARHFPNYYLEMIPEAGHWVHYDATQRFGTLVEKHFRNISSHL